VRFDEKKRAKIRKFCGASLALAVEIHKTDMSPERVVIFFGMTRVLALLVALTPTVTITLAEDQLRANKSEGSDSFDVEPPTPKQNVAADRSTPEPSGDAVGRLERQLEEAKRDAKDVERLCKIGALSKSEMEQRLLKVIHCESELASARLAKAKEKIAELESGVTAGESAKNQLASAKAALKQLSEATEAAEAKRERAELEAAEANVRRQQQLLKLGVAAKSDVDHAEEKLDELKAQKR
jgi:multidrug resistance efflux pump